MKTIVIGASPNPTRFSFRAVKLLNSFGHDTIPIGIRKGFIDQTEILTGKPKVDSVHTVTLYIGMDKQSEYYEYILSLNPKRIIFNPGTENNELYNMAKSKGIETVENCTLVMLNSGIY